MTKEAMYDALRKRNGCYPSTRYDERYRESKETYSWDTEINGYFGKDDNMNFNNVKLLIDGQIYNTHDVIVTENYGEFPLVEASAYLNHFNTTSAKIPCCGYNKFYRTPKTPTIENVIFNPPATIVFWSDKTKTVVKCDYEYEAYDPEKGIAMAIAKKLMGDNKGHYYELFKHWRKKWDEQKEAAEDIKIDIPKSPIEKLANSITNAFTKPATDWLDDLNP